MVSVMQKWAQAWADKSPRAYVMIWVSFWNFCSLSNCPIAYGWNVWVDDLLYKFYGNGVEKTMANGGCVYAFSLIIFFLGWGNLTIILTKLHERTLPLNLGFCKITIGGVRDLYVIGVIGSAICGVLMALAIQYKHMWLLYVGCTGFGIFGSFEQPVVRIAISMAYQKVGMKGIGNGMSSAWVGIWAAAFSYWGVALSNATSIESAVYIATAIQTVVAIVPIPFINVNIPYWEIYHERSRAKLAKQQENETPKQESSQSTNQTGGDEDGDNSVRALEAEAGVEVDAAVQRKDSLIARDTPVKMSCGMVLKTSQFWILWWVFQFMMAPPFGVKYLISPMLNSVYDASQSTQTLASFLFLVFYAIARFAGGALDFLFNSMHVLRVMTGIAIPVFVVQGILAQQYGSHAALTGFICCQVVTGMVLGSAKVLIFILCFDIYKPLNFVNACCMLLSTFGTASLVGPLFGWWSLSNHGVATDANYKDDLSSNVGIFCYVSAGCMAAAFVLTFFVRKLDFRKWADESARVFAEEDEPILAGDVQISEADFGIGNEISMKKLQSYTKEMTRDLEDSAEPARRQYAHYADNK